MESNYLTSLEVEELRYKGQEKLQSQQIEHFKLRNVEINHTQKYMV